MSLESKPPLSRSWRDIPQPFKPRTMSRLARWRLTWSGLKLAGAVAVVGAVGWGGWMAVGALQNNSMAMPAVAKAVPVRTPEFKTDGVLTVAWLERTLALRKNASLMELDLKKLQARLLAEPQVLTAVVARSFPDRLHVTITERAPIARVKVEFEGAIEERVVANDGVIFSGEGHAQDFVAALPLLEGVKPAAQGANFEPIAGMAAVAELLRKAQFQAQHLYRSWRTIGLERLDKDRAIVVRTAEGFSLVFQADEDVLRQLAKLDFIWERVAHVPAAQTAQIDLSLGREVPVMIELVRPPQPLSRTAASNAKAALPKPAPIQFLLSGSPKSKREL